MRLKRLFYLFRKADIPTDLKVVGPGKKSILSSASTCLFYKAGRLNLSAGFLYLDEKNYSVILNQSTSLFSMILYLGVFSARVSAVVL